MPCLLPPEGSDYPNFFFQGQRGICLLLWNWNSLGSCIIP